MPFDDYEELRDKLIEMIPDFRLRLKVNHKSNRVVLAADIHSVFDIAWYTLAKKVCEDAQPTGKGSGTRIKKIGTEREKLSGMVPIF